MGTAPSSVNVTRMSRAASSLATRVASPAGACTIKPTSAWSVLTWVIGWTRNSTLARAATSSVDSVQVPMLSSSRNGVANATSRSRHRGIERTRRGASRTRSTAASRSCSGELSSPGSPSRPGRAGSETGSRWLTTVANPTAVSPPGRGRGLRPSLTSRSSSRLSAASGARVAPTSAKLAWTCARSSSVFLASRSRSSVAIARVFRRACPTGSP